MAFFKYNKELISMFEDTMGHFRSGNGLLPLEEHNTTFPQVHEYESAGMCVI